MSAAPPAAGTASAAATFALSARQAAGRRLSFRTVLVLLFAAQIVVACGVTAALAFADGRRAVRGVLALLRDQVAARARDDIADLVRAPHHVAALNAEALDLGRLDARGWEEIERVCFEQMRAFPQLSFAGFANEHGEYMAIGRADAGLFVEERDLAESVLVYRWLTAAGERGERFKSVPDYDARRRPWYRAPVEAGKPIWSPIYAIVGSPPRLTSTATRPYYDARSALVGVLLADVVLTDASRYLQTLAAGAHGEIFVIERTGDLVAASSLPEVVAEVDGEPQRVPALACGAPRVRAATRFLGALPGGLAGIDDEVLVDADLDGEPHLVTALPLYDAYGLDWLVVVVIPEEVYLGPIHAATRRTLLLCAVAVALAVALAAASARWLSRPLVDLAEKAHQIQAGDLDVEIEARSDDEIGALAVALSDMLQGLRDRDHIRDAFGRYVTPGLVERFLSDPKSLQLGGHLQGVTILMSDLRGFTALSSRLEPDALVRLLNRYFGVMADVVIERGGMINEFLGDGILALFGAPEEIEDDAERAVCAAVAMQRALAELNRGALAAVAGVSDLPPLVMGIGIHSGRVVAGNIGGEQKVKYGVVGEAVNLAARIEGLTVGPQVLVSADTYARVAGIVEARGPRVVRVKGRAEPLGLYEVLSVDEGAVRLAMPPQVIARWIDVDLEVLLHPVVGKELAAEAIAARASALSRAGLRVRLEAPLAIDTNVVASLVRPGGGATSGSDARVTAIDADGVVTVSFTSLRDEERAEVDRRLDASAGGA